MPFQTVIRARVPRLECATDGGKTLAGPWAEPHGRFPRLFERFAIDVLLGARSLTQAANLLGLSWDARWIPAGAGRWSAACRAGSSRRGGSWALTKRVSGRASHSARR